MLAKENITFQFILSSSLPLLLHFFLLSSASSKQASCSDSGLQPLYCKDPMPTVGPSDTRITQHHLPNSGALITSAKPLFPAQSQAPSGRDVCLESVTQQVTFVVSI